MGRTCKLRPPVDNGDGTHSIILTKGLVAVVDSSCAMRGDIAGHNWHAQPGCKTFYAKREEHPRGVRRTVYLHRAILGTNSEVDHRDGDGLNNRVANLRLVSSSSNKRNIPLRRDNTSGFKGVSKVGSRWRAEISVGGRSRHLGRFDTPEEAAAAFDKAALEIDPEHYVINGALGASRRSSAC